MHFQQWLEEVLLVKEEMHRVLAYLKYKAAQWIILCHNHGCTVSPEIQEDLHAYSGSQSQLLRDMAKGFQEKWAVLQGRELTVEELRWLLHPQEHRRKNPINANNQYYNGLMGDGMASEDEGIEDAEDVNEVVFD